MKTLVTALVLTWTTSVAANDFGSTIFLGGDQKPTAQECANAVKNGNLVASTLVDGYRPFSVMAYDGFLFKIRIDDGSVFCLRKQKLR